MATTTMSPLELLRAKIKKLLTERDGLSARLDDVIAEVEARGDSDFRADEKRRFDGISKSIRELDRELVGLRADEDGMLENQRAQDAAAAAQQHYAGHSTSTGWSAARVTSEPHTYGERGDHSFIRDAMTRFSDPDAAERIARSQREALVDKRASVGTAGFGALVVPQYLTDFYAEVVRSGRPFLNAIAGEDLPDEGMSLNIPRGTTGTSVLQQTSENTQVASVTFDETTLVVPVNTYSGDQDVSRQALDRGRGTDRIIFSDLGAAYVTRVNFDALQGPGTNGRHLGILSTTNGVTTVTFSGTAGQTTAAGLHSKVAESVAWIAGARFLQPTVVVMHPRRWAWILNARDSQGRPLVVPNQQVPQNAMGLGSGASPVGTLLGLPVVTDASIPTTVSSSTFSGATEDQVIVTRAEDIHIWEDSPGPTTVEFRETLAGQLTVKVVAWGYSAFTAGRYPTSTAIISGSSLTTPTFS